MLSSYRARRVASLLPRLVVPNAATGFAAAVTAQGLRGGPPLAAARGVRTARWAPRAPLLCSHGDAASARASSVWARRGAEGVASGVTDESQSLTGAERTAIDTAVEKMAQRVTEAGEWDGIDSWAKVRCLGSALERRLHEIGVPAAKTDKPLESRFRNLARCCDNMKGCEFELEYAQFQVKCCLCAYRKLIPPKTTWCPVCAKPWATNV
jgi:hypothetical protein